MFEVTYKDIEALTSEQLPDLLRRLLIAEARLYKLTFSELHVPGNITVADGGEDGRIELVEDPPSGCRFTRRLTIFQCKASDLGPAACAREVRKPQVAKCLAEGGSYVLFLIRSLTQTQIDKRIQAMRKQMEADGRSYAATADISIFDANKIRDWTNQHVSAVVAVQNCMGRPQIPGLRTWQDWSGEKDLQEFSFVAGQVIENQLKELREALSKDRSVVRLLGLSGLGKTRLALEALRPVDISHQVAYKDVEGSDGDLNSVVISWRGTRMSGLLVVDNCPLVLHERLKKAVEHTESRLRLLTLYNDPDEKPSHYPFNVKKMPDDLIKKMLQEFYGERLVFDLDRVVKYAQGFPQMAVLLARARIDGERHLGQIVDDILLNKLLGDRLPDDSKKRRVLEACAIFSMVGFEGDRAEEYQYIAEHIIEIKPDDFYRYVTTTLKPRQLVQQAGRFIRVEPMPLAVRLAAKWWEGCSPERIATIVMSDLPGGLSQALCDRMAMLDFLPKVQELVRKLCGNQGPFGQAEVLNSELGSRLFRSLAEVNPNAALDAMERAFGDCSRDQLLAVGPGRRNLVWLLEKLCFRRELFPRAARLMLAFAAAENESWGNNASGQFRQFFQTYLSGTEASPEDRLPLLDEALASSEPERRALAVQAMDKALTVGHYSRSGGAEAIGSGPARQDWQPRNGSEVLDYWREVLNRLTIVALGDDPLAAQARAILGSHIRILVSYLPDALDEAISQVIDRHGPIWLEALESIQHAFSFDGQGMPGNIRALLAAWQERLTPPPEDVAGRLHAVVSQPPWQHEKEENGQFIDVAASNAKALAEELAQAGSEWLEHLPSLLQGEQRQGLSFGRRLGEVIADPGPFIDGALQVLANLSPARGYSIVLEAFLGGMCPRFPELVGKTLDRAAAEPALHPYLVGMTQFVNPTMADLSRILDLVKQGRIPSRLVAQFAYGRILGHLPPEDMMAFCETLALHDVDAAWAALDLLAMYCNGDEPCWQACRAGLCNILMHPNLVIRQDLNTMDIHDWGMVAQKLLKMGDEPDLAAHLTRTIIETCRASRVLNLNSTTQPILRRLLDSHREVAWPIIEDAWLADDPVFVYMLTNLLGDSFKKENGEPGPLFALPNDFLLAWCRKHPAQAPKRIAHIMPLFDQKEEEWTPLARDIIDEFGSQKEVLSAISANMGPFIAWGSPVPRYQRQREVMEELSDHQLSVVRKWVSHHLNYLDQQIKRETNMDQEEDWGV